VTYDDGNIVRNVYGECWHTSSWTRANATIVGCDGVVLNKEIDVIKGEGTGLVTAVAIPAATLFTIDSDVLTDEGKMAIEDLRKSLGSELNQAYAAVIIGHADNTGNARHNQDLSLRRAKSVKNYLVSTGTPEQKLRVIGKGEKKPIASNSTKDGRAQNRRVEIIVIGEVRALDALRFSSVALFQPRGFELTENGKEMLEINRKAARELFEQSSYIEIVGHTDDVGDDKYNMDLSIKRAKAVRDYLIQTGLDSSNVTTKGMGESKPIASNNTAQGRAENRRVEILILGRTK
jgi:OOP family OmpA-OmpF porin